MYIVDYSMESGFPLAVAIFAICEKIIIVAIKIRHLRKNLAKKIYITIYFPPSCLFTFFRVSRNLSDQTILGIHLELRKSIVSWLHFKAIDNKGLINKGVDWIVWQNDMVKWLPLNVTYRNYLPLCDARVWSKVLTSPPFKDSLKESWLKTLIIIWL